MFRHRQTGNNRWIILADKEEAPFDNSTKTCDCVERLGIIFVEDTQKVYRCAVCGAPAVHPDISRDTFELKYKIIRDTRDPGQWPEFNWLIVDLQSQLTSTPN